MLDERILSGMYDNGAKQVPSLRSQFWIMYASIENDTVINRDSHERNLTSFDSSDSSRPSDVELVGFVNRYIPDSSCHYAGSLPLTAQSQENHVLIRSNNCWRTLGPIVPAKSPSFRQVDRLLKSHYAGSAQSTSEINNDIRS